MDRKHFIQSCAGGLCAGAASVDAAGAEKTEDWRVRFVQRRYSRLLEILSRRMGEKDLKDTLREMGSCCASFADEATKKYRGDLDGFAKSIQQSVSGDTVTYDPEKRVVTMASSERTACFCPFFGAAGPGFACNCSLGWQQHTWETFFEKKVTVDIEEAFLRGGKRCVFKIHVTADPLS
jgi:predicted ArsR family transcriptional regulator